MSLVSVLKRLTPAPLRARLRTSLSRALARCNYHYGGVYGYAEDGLFTSHNDSFRGEPDFRDAYARGVQAGGRVDPHFEWRIHVALWAARTALRAPGDFVECGVNAGFVSSAIMRRLDWARVPRTYYLIDTFAGPPLDQYSKAEIASGRLGDAARALAAGAYINDIERVRANFAEWPNAIALQGAVPAILESVPVGWIAFLHLDMNATAPECAALEHFWSRLSRGAVVLLDDYAYYGYDEQNKALKELAQSHGAEVLSLPTGQGLIVV